MYYNDKSSPGFKYRPRLKVWTDGTNNEFNPEAFEATSYRWWVYVCKIKGRVVFNNYPYSNSTCGHQSAMRALLKRLKVRDVVQVSMRESLGHFRDKALPALYRDLFEIEARGRTARKARVWSETQNRFFASRAKAVAAIKEQIKVCRSLGAECSREAIKSIKVDVETSNAERLASNREKSRNLASQRKALKPQVSDTSAVDLSFFNTESVQAIDLNQQLNEGA